MVGGMGHSSSVSLGYSIKMKKVFCLDGDGSMLMHLGALATCAQKGNKNFKYILLNNYCHESGWISTNNIKKKLILNFIKIIKI